MCIPRTQGVVDVDQVFSWPDRKGSGYQGSYSKLGRLANRADYRYLIVVAEGGRLGGRYIRQAGRWEGGQRWPRVAAHWTRSRQSVLFQNTCRPDVTSAVQRCGRPDETRLRHEPVTAGVPVPEVQEHACEDRNRIWGPDAIKACASASQPHARHDCLAPSPQIAAEKATTGLSRRVMPDATFPCMSLVSNFKQRGFGCAVFVSLIGFLAKRLPCARERNWAGMCQVGARSELPEYKYIQSCSKAEEFTA